MLDDVDPVLDPVGIAELVGANVENSPLDKAGGTRGPRALRPLARAWRNGRVTPRSRSGVAQPPSSVSAEIGWLAFFLVVFVAAVYLFVRSLVPHHFNDKIAIVLAAIFAGLVMIAARAWVTGRWRRG